MAASRSSTATPTWSMRPNTGRECRSNVVRRSELARTEGRKPPGGPSLRGPKDENPPQVRACEDRRTKTPRRSELARTEDRTAAHDMDVALICNPQSGPGVDADGTAERLRALGASIVELAHTPDEARGDGAERLVVVGGDGTIAPAAALAARRGIPLAVVPGGTANDFARA